MSTRNIIQALQGAAGAAAGGAGLDVDEVFSTHLYDGTGSAQTITNNVDLTEGGLVWLKHRSSSSFSAADHWLIDTERGGTKYLNSNDAGAEAGNQNYISAFNSNGFTLGTSDAEINFGSGNSKYTSWTFRKAPNFFDVITYSGNSTAGRTISHNLGCTVGAVWVKRLNTTNNWICWHREIANNQYLQLNNNSSAYSDGGIFWNNTTPSSSTVTLGADSGVNATGSTYVMYVFAHNNSDGGFGPDGDQDIIKCGSYTGTGASQEINLGFEAQWLLIKNTTNAQSWAIIDNMRGFTVEGVNDEILTPDDSSAEAGDNRVFPTALGFGVHTADYRFNGSGSNYIYMAIRRGPLAEPTSASDVFAISTYGQGGSSAPAYTSNFPVDMYFERPINMSFHTAISSRLTAPKYLRTNATNAEVADSGLKYDFMDGVYNSTGTLTNYYAWMWKRAPSYFDVITWSGDGVVDRTVSHNLGAVPEMWWVKQRDGTGHWAVQHKVFPSINKLLYLNLNGSYSQGYTNFIAPTSTSICIGGYGNLGGTSNSNASGADYIGYLFATVAGVSKVGSYTGNGTSQTINCGFSNGAKFVLIKRTNDLGNWHVWDTARGIVSGNDPFLELDTTNTENSSYDSIDPDNSGFIINNTINTLINASGSTYIFYAIAT